MDLVWGGRRWRQFADGADIRSVASRADEREEERLIISRRGPEASLSALHRQLPEVKRAGEGRGGGIWQSGNCCCNDTPVQRISSL